MIGVSSCGPITPPLLFASTFRLWRGRNLSDICDRCGVSGLFRTTCMKILFQRSDTRTQFADGFGLLKRFIGEIRDQEGKDWNGDGNYQVHEAPYTSV